MFYVCDKKNGKFGVKDTYDSIIEYYTPKELISINKSLTKIYGVSDSKISLINISEYQELDLNEYKVFSFITDNDIIYLGLENKSSHKTIYSDIATSYFVESEMIPMCKNKNGDLYLIANSDKYIAFGIRLLFKDCYGVHEKLLEMYLRVYKDSDKVKRIAFKNFNKPDMYYYSSFQDCVRMRDGGKVYE